jgi:hypothetical protein
VPFTEPIEGREEAGGQHDYMAEQILLFLDPATSRLFDVGTIPGSPRLVDWMTQDLRRGCLLYGSSKNEESFVGVLRVGRQIQYEELRLPDGIFALAGWLQTADSRSDRLLLFANTLADERTFVAQEADLKAGRLAAISTDQISRTSSPGEGMSSYHSGGPWFTLQDVRSRELRVDVWSRMLAKNLAVPVVPPPRSVAARIHRWRLGGW